MTNKQDKDKAYEQDIRKLSDAYKDSEKDKFIRKEISSFSNMSPEVVAQLIRSWMNNDDE